MKKTTKKTKTIKAITRPFNYNELKKKVDGAGYIECIVAVDFNELIDGHGIDELNDLVSCEITGADCGLLGIDYKLIGTDGDNVLFKVSGQPDMEFLEEFDYNRAEE